MVIIIIPNSDKTVSLTQAYLCINSFIPYNNVMSRSIIISLLWMRKICYAAQKSDRVILYLVLPSALPLPSHHLELFLFLLTCVFSFCHGHM